MKPNLEFLATNDEKGLAAYSSCTQVRGYISKVLSRVNSTKCKLELFYKSSTVGQIPGTPSVQFETNEEKLAFYETFNVQKPKKDLEYRTIIVHMGESPQGKIPKAISMAPLQTYVRPSEPSTYVAPRIVYKNRSVPLKVGGNNYLVLDGVIRHLTIQHKNTRPFSSYAPQIAKLLEQYYTGDYKPNATFVLQLPPHEEYSRINVKNGVVSDITLNKKRVAKPQELPTPPQKSPQEQDEPKQLPRGTHGTKSLYDYSQFRKKASPSSISTHIDVPQEKSEGTITSDENSRSTKDEF